MNKILIVMAILASSSLIAYCEAKTNKSSPFAGLSDEQYSRCIDLGADVMNKMETYGLDSQQHIASYDKWDSLCSITALWEVADNPNFPVSPLEWAKRK